MEKVIPVPVGTAKEIADFLVRKGLGRKHRLVMLLDPPQSQVVNWNPLHTWQSGPSIPAMGSCGICGAAVFMDDAEHHTAWHAKRDADD